MKVNDQMLILDNFRTILSGYSTDIQDVVRSAVLDGVDISKYISACKDNPYRLDQIRLCMKEGLEEPYYKISSGEVIYRIRRLKGKGTDISLIETQLKKGNLNTEYLNYLIQWAEDGVNTFGLDISIVPSDLLSIFDYGLRSGFDMRVFNNGTLYSADYIRYCLQIIKNKKPLKNLLNGKYSLEVVNMLCAFSKLSLGKWEMLLDGISGDEGISLKRLKMLMQLVKNDIDVKELQTKDKKGSYIYEDACLEIVYKAHTNKIDYIELISKAKTSKEMSNLYNEMIYSKKSVSGRLRKTSV